MTVYIAFEDDWDETSIDGVYASLESAKAAYPTLVWVTCGDGVEASGLGRGHRFILEPFEVQGIETR